MGSIGETKISMHISFLLVALVMLAGGYGCDFLIYAGSLLIHEMGHLLAASLEGISIWQVELWPFGAVGKLEYGWQVEPKAEIATSVGGPLSNASLAAAASLVKGVIGKATLANGIALEFPMLDVLIVANLSLFAVNLIPLLPLDGGRVFRALLSMRQGYVPATRTAGKLSRTLGLALAAFGVISAILGCFPMLGAAVVGGAIYLGSSEETRDITMAQVYEVLRRKEKLKERKIIPVAQILVKEDALVKDVVAKLSPSRYYLMLVTGPDLKVKRTVGETAVLKAYCEGKINLAVKDIPGLEGA